MGFEGLNGGSFSKIGDLETPGVFRIHKGMWWCLSGIAGDDFENAEQCYQYYSAGQVRAEVETKITMIAINANNNSDNRSRHARTWRWPLDVASLAGL